MDNRKLPILKICKCFGLPEYIHIKRIDDPSFHGIRVACTRCNKTTAVFQSKAAAARAWNKGEAK